jgi:hypothetical protein
MNAQKNSSESFALNCQFVLRLMQIGEGSSEAGVIFTYLDLPHSSTFHKNTFPRVQDAIRLSIIKVSSHMKWPRI